MPDIPLIPAMPPSAGIGSGASDWLFSQATRLARSWPSLMPANAIVVPGTKSFGLIR